MLFRRFHIMWRNNVRRIGNRHAIFYFHGVLALNSSRKHACYPGEISLRPVNNFAQEFTTDICELCLVCIRRPLIRDHDGCCQYTKSSNHDQQLRRSFLSISVRIFWGFNFCENFNLLNQWGAFINILWPSLFRLHWNDVERSRISKCLNGFDDWRNNCGLPALFTFALAWISMISIFRIDEEFSQIFPWPSLFLFH